MSSPRVGIVGGGLLGLTAAYRLQQAGMSVSVFEKAPVLGGLAASVELDGIPIDRFYHVVLPTDDCVRGLAGELGLGDRFRFARTSAGFYDSGRLFSMNTPRELLRFPLLRPHDRLRLGAFALRCQLKSTHDDLDQIPLEDWLRHRCGKRAWEDLWRPLLDSKFDGCFDDLPATYLWARSRRMASTRERGSNEVMGTLDGGYQILVDALAEAIRAGGGEIHTSTPVREVASLGGRAAGLVTTDGFHSFDHILGTMLPPIMARLLPADLADAVGPDRMRYLGVVCVVARLKRSISPYYLVNITDRSIPLTTVVETTHIVDPERVGGTLIYIPRYVQPDSPDLERSSLELRNEYLAHARTIFPALREEDVLATQVARARLAEPVHVLGSAGTLPPLTPAPGLTLASSAHVYPELVNGQAVIGVAERVAAEVLERAEQRVAEEAVA